MDRLPQAPAGLRDPKTAGPTAACCGGPRATNADPSAHLARWPRSGGAAAARRVSGPRGARSRGRPLATGRVKRRQAQQSPDRLPYPSETPRVWSRELTLTLTHIWGQPWGSRFIARDKVRALFQPGPPLTPVGRLRPGAGPGPRPPSPVLACEPGQFFFWFWGPAGGRYLAPKAVPAAPGP